MCVCLRGGVLGGRGGFSGKGLGHETHENLSCSRINSYFDPSVGSDWASLVSICLPGISPAPENPAGFLRVDGIRMVLD